MRAQRPHITLRTISTTVSADIQLEPGSRLVPESEVKNSTGAERARWIEAAQAELSQSFQATGAITRATPEELQRLGGRAKTLPMNCV